MGFRLAQKDAQFQSLPHRQHVDDASQLHHKLRHHVERVLVLRLEDVHRPNVDVADVVAAGNHLLVQPMEVPTEADVLLHPEHVVNDLDVVRGEKRLLLATAPEREQFDPIVVELGRFVRGIFAGLGGEDLNYILGKQVGLVARLPETIILPNLQEPINLYSHSVSVYGPTTV